MPPTDTYHTITTPTEGFFKDRGSRFLAYAAPAESEEEIKAHLADIRQQHPKSRHHCYAYRLGHTGDLFRANDDGEPSGTAGRPILGQIDKLELTNVTIVVVRYFGGTLLGTSGLINAYRTAAAEALAQAEIVERIVCDHFLLTYHYAHTSSVMNAIKRLDFEMVSQDFGNEAKVTVAIRQRDAETKVRQLKASVAGVYLEEVDELERIDGFQIEKL